MTINSTNRLAGPFSGNGVSTVFPFTFKVFAAADVLVVQTIAGVDYTLVLNTDYNVALNANQNANPGGSITLSAALAAGASLVVTSSLAYTQQTDLTNQGGFYPAVITDALDRLTIFAQQIVAKVVSSLRAPVSDGNVDMTLPGKATRATKLLAFDNNGLPVPSNLTLTQLEQQPTNAAASATAAADSAAGAAAALFSFNGVYLGGQAADPTTDLNGNALGIGDLYTNSSSGKLRVYTAGGWVDAGTAAPVSFTQNLFSGNGTLKNFSLSVAPYSNTALIVTVNGLKQRLTSDYTLSGTTLSFVTAPATGTNNIEVLVFSAINFGVPNDNSIATSKVQDGSITPAKLSTGAPSWTSGGALTVPGSLAASGATVTTLTASGVAALTGGATTTTLTTSSNASLANARWTADTAGNVQRVLPGGAVLYPDFACRAWAFSSNAGVLQAGGNVTSVARTGTGLFTVSFSAAMPDANYSLTTGVDDGGFADTTIMETTRSTSSVSFSTQSGTTQRDVAFSLAVFR